MTLKEIEERLFVLERTFDKNIISYEEYMRQRSILIGKTQGFTQKLKNYRS